MNPVANQVVVITGGARGIGAACAAELTRRGAYVAILDSDGACATQTAKSLGRNASAYAVDVTDRTALREAFAAIAEVHGGIDTVIANAGISGPVGPVLDADPAALAKVIDINLLGVIETIHAALPYVVERQGYVLAVASAAAVIPTPAIAAYGASKAGVDAFARALRVELKPKGAAVGVAYFGLVETELIYGEGAAPGIEQLLTGVPGPIGRPVPASRAAEVIVRGIERRSDHVFAPGWVRALAGLRGQLQPLDRFASSVPRIAAMIGAKQ
jgi:NAD(P)-dependent dehydrogenase (short-subunit alcohol dehydrogenase family)